jgi:hypothetical protein
MSKQPFQGRDVGPARDAVRRARNTRWSAHHSSAVIKSTQAASRCGARIPMFAPAMAADRHLSSDSTTSYA